MSPSLEELKSSIDIKPVPEWKEAFDSKLKARNLINYTLEKPTREEVFKTNYARRTLQMHAQGYYSAPWKPYQEVGKPLYLDGNVLMQVSLGQEPVDEKERKTMQQDELHTTENDQKRMEPSRKPRSKSARIHIETNSAKHQRPTSAFSVAKKRQRENLQNIEKDLDLLKESMIKVKKGQSLFLILDEDNISDYLNKNENQGISFRNKSRNEKEMCESVVTKSTTTKQQAFQRVGSKNSLFSFASGTSTRSALVAQKAERQITTEQTRPYTPIHSNISRHTDSSYEFIRIWRQLCALHWVLLSCQLETKSENHKVMIPLSECWDPLNPGGKTRDFRTVQEEKKTNRKWVNFTRVSTRNIRNRNRRKNSTYSSNVSNPKKIGGIPRVSSYASELGGMRTVSSVANELISSKQGRNRNLWKNAAHSTLVLNPKKSSVDTGGIPRVSSVASELGNICDNISSRQRQPSGLSVLASNDGDDADAFGIKPSRPSSPGQLSVATTVVGGTIAGSDCGADDDSVGTENVQNSVPDLEKKKEDEDWFIEKDTHEHLKKLLSTVEQSVVGEMKKRERTAQFVAKANRKLPLSVYEWSRTSYFKIGKEFVNISRIVIPSATPITDFSEPRPNKKVIAAKVRPHTATGAKIRNSSQSASNDVVVLPSTAAASPKSKPTRPMSSPAKLETHFNFKFSSGDKEKQLDAIIKKFEEVADAKAMQLHNKLLELEKRRKQRMETKFESLSNTRSIHRDLKEMRHSARSRVLSEKRAIKKEPCQPSDWFNILDKNLPECIKDDKKCRIILTKLNFIAREMMEEVRKVTPDVFLNALRKLRPWELCSPDVSSAVEFIRENIVHMNTEEYDNWRLAKITHKEVLKGSDSKTIK